MSGTYQLRLAPGMLVSIQFARGVFVLHSDQGAPQSCCWAQPQRVVGFEAHVKSQKCARGVMLQVDPGAGL